MQHHDKIPIWTVEISVIGPVTIAHSINFDARKELEHPHPFYSNVQILSEKNGFKAVVTAFAPNSDLAEKAATLWFGRMLDVLSLHLNLSLQLDVTNNVIIQKSDFKTKRLLDRDDFVNAFHQSRILSIAETTFLRSLSWFRKGKYSQDPYDKFLAFWNSIEIVAAKYNPNRANCKGKGTICHIWECFIKLWGKIEEWEFIEGQTKWIDEGNDLRVAIAHGTEPIEIDSLNRILIKLPEVENVAHKFLIEWLDKELKPEITEDLIKKIR